MSLYFNHWRKQAIDQVRSEDNGEFSNVCPFQKQLRSVEVPRSLELGNLLDRWISEESGASTFKWLKGTRVQPSVA